MYYSTLKGDRGHPGYQRPVGRGEGRSAATIRIHAVHVADGEIACGYTSKADDIAEPDRDWFDDVPPGELPCEACRDAIQPDVERRATP